MKPQDVDRLLVLRHQASLARQTAENFEKEKSVAPEGREALTPAERFENAWNYSQGLIDPRMTAGSTSKAVTFRRSCWITTESGHSQYAIHFELDNQIEGRRSIRAIWELLKVTENGVMSDSYYEYTELFSEDSLEKNIYLDRLANIETSVEAFENAVPGEEELLVLNGGTLQQ